MRTLNITAAALTAMALFSAPAHAASQNVSVTVDFPSIIVLRCLDTKNISLTAAEIATESGLDFTSGSGDTDVGTDPTAAVTVTKSLGDVCAFRATGAAEVSVSVGTATLTDGADGSMTITGVTTTAVDTDGTNSIFVRNLIDADITLDVSDATEDGSYTGGSITVEVTGV